MRFAPSIKRARSIYVHTKFSYCHADLIMARNSSSSIIFNVNEKKYGSQDQNYDLEIHSVLICRDAVASLERLKS